MNLDHLLHPNNCTSNCSICYRLRENELELTIFNNKIKGVKKMAKNIFWVVKDSKGNLQVDDIYEIYFTRNEIRENVALSKGEKFVKVRFVEVTKDI